MSVRIRRATRNPFTVVVCSDCRDDHARVMVDALRATVRRCSNGMLVTTECLFGPRFCAESGNRGGTLVVVQPCTVDRRPHGPIRRIGPVADGDDVHRLCRWLERGDWDAGVGHRS